MRYPFKFGQWLLRGLHLSMLCTGTMDLLYPLKVSGYSSDAGDGLNTGDYHHNNMMFSTYDNDSDLSVLTNCEGYYSGKITKPTKLIVFCAWFCYINSRYVMLVAFDGCCLLLNVLACSLKLNTTQC